MTSETFILDTAIPCSPAVEEGRAVAPLHVRVAGQGYERAAGRAEGADCLSP